MLVTSIHADDQHTTKLPEHQNLNLSKNKPFNLEDRPIAQLTQKQRFHTSTIHNAKQVDRTKTSGSALPQHQLRRSLRSVLFASLQNKNENFI